MDILFHTNGGALLKIALHLPVSRQCQNPFSFLDLVCEKESEGETQGLPIYRQQIT